MKNSMKKKVNIGRKYVNILGINVISTSERELLSAIQEKITHNVKFYVVTPNPELVLMSERDKPLKDALNSSEFPVPDGTGLYYASEFLYGKNLNIIHGRKLFMSLMELANKKSWRIFFLGGENEEARLSSEKLKHSYQRVKIESFAGPMVDNSAKPKSEKDRKLETEAISRINRFKPQLLFVAMKNPKQEIWIHKNLKKLNAGGAMTVGGTFRYVAGMSELPPKWMDKAGLEWIWRLITEPYRFRRIFNAFPIFPLRVFWFKISGR